MPLTPDQIKATLEAAIFTSEDPISVDKLCALFEEEKGIIPKAIREMLEHLQKDYHNHGIELVEVATGYRFQVKEEISPTLGVWLQERPSKYSRAILETLAIMAYKQPATRADIEQVRGVAVSTHIIKTLLGREWIKVAGHRDVPGKPALYATTKQFLDYFGLKSLTELPELLESHEDEAAEQLMLELEHKEGEGAQEGEQNEENIEALEQEEGAEETEQADSEEEEVEDDEELEEEDEVEQEEDAEVTEDGDDEFEEDDDDEEEDSEEEPEIEQEEPGNIADEDLEAVELEDTEEETL